MAEALAPSPAHPFVFEGLPVRVTEIDGEPWFVAADVCAALDLSNPSETLKRLDADEVTLSQIEGSRRPVNLINESGLFALILRSDKPKAKPFRRWVTGEVLPTIRRTGAYVAPGARDQVDRYTVCNVFLSTVFTALPSLCERSRQALVCTVTADVIGRPLLPAPVIDEPFWTTTEIAAELGVSASTLGRKATKAGLKTKDYGEERLGKAKGHDKQIPQFYWNSHGRDALAALMEGRANG